MLESDYPDKLHKHKCIICNRTTKDCKVRYVHVMKTVDYVCSKCQKREATDDPNDVIPTFDVHL